MSEVERCNGEGKKVLQLHQLASGSAIDMGCFNAGLYMIRIPDRNGEMRTVKVTKK